MKTTKTSIGNVPGKDGDEDPNKDRWTFGYKSSHANDNKPSVIEIKYQQLIESNKTIRHQADEASTALSEVLNKIGINIKRLNLLATQNRENKERLNNLEKTIQDNTNNLKTLQSNMDIKIQEMSKQMAQELEKNKETQQYLYQQYVTQTNQIIEHKNNLIGEQIAQYRQEILTNNEEVINNSANRINEIAENATTNIFNNITNFILTFGGLFDTRIVGYIGIIVIGLSVGMLIIRSRGNEPQTIIIQQTPATSTPMIELPMQQTINNNDNSIKSELRETGGLIVKLLKLVNKWLNVLYEKQLEKLEKYKKK